MVHAKVQPGAWAVLKQPQGESGMGDFTAGLFNPQSQSPQSIAGDIPHVQWASPASSASTTESPGDVLVRKQQQDVMDEDGHCRDKPERSVPGGCSHPAPLPWQIQPVPGNRTASWQSQPKPVGGGPELCWCHCLTSPEISSTAGAAAGTRPHPRAPGFMQGPHPAASAPLQHLPSPCLFPNHSGPS